MAHPILLILLFLLILGAVPAVPGSRNWRFFPSAALGLVVLVMFALLLITVV